MKKARKALCTRIELVQSVGRCNPHRAVRRDIDMVYLVMTQGSGVILIMAQHLELVPVVAGKTITEAPEPHESMGVLRDRVYADVAEARCAV